MRYYACEALYNIVKVARGSVLSFFNEVFDGLSKVSLYLLSYSTFLILVCLFTEKTHSWQLAHIFIDRLLMHLLSGKVGVPRPFRGNNSFRRIRTPSNCGWEMSGHKCCINSENFTAISQAPWEKVKLS